jgi:type IV pilus assembly protein PilE
MTLFELMIVVAVVAILVSVAYPSYSGFIRKANRAEAHTTLLDWANRQENWRADHTSYSADFTPDSTEYYSYSMESTATSFTLTATALGTQLNDKEKGVPCSSMNINEAGVVGPPSKQVCWKK